MACNQSYSLIEQIFPCWLDEHTLNHVARLFKGFTPVKLGISRIVDRQKARNESTLFVNSAWTALKNPLMAFLS